MRRNRARKHWCRRPRAASRATAPATARARNSDSRPNSSPCRKSKREKFRGENPRTGWFPSPRPMAAPRARRPRQSPRRSPATAIVDAAPPRRHDPLKQRRARHETDQQPEQHADDAPPHQFAQQPERRFHRLPYRIGVGRRDVLERLAEQFAPHQEHDQNRGAEKNAGRTPGTRQRKQARQDEEK